MPHTYPGYVHTPGNRRPFPQPNSPWPRSTSRPLSPPLPSSRLRPTSRIFCRPCCPAAGFGQPRDFCRPQCPAASGSGHLRGLHRPRRDATSGYHRSCRDKALGYHCPCCHFSSAQHIAAGPPRTLDFHTLVGRSLACPPAAPSLTAFHRPRRYVPGASHLRVDVQEQTLPV